MKRFEFLEQHEETDEARRNRVLAGIAIRRAKRAESAVFYTLATGAPLSVLERARIAIAGYTVSKDHDHE